MIYKLKFTDQAEWESTLAQLDEEAYNSFVVVGTLYEDPVYDIELQEYLPPVAVDGFHVDVDTDGRVPVLEPFHVVVTRTKHRYGMIANWEVLPPVPNASWLKADIQAWLTEHGIEWTTSMLKADLLTLCQ